MPGTVVTFYSYKGGVGRSFALANIAVLLARWGYRVLCVDWDLEAPGLHHYFQPMLGVPIQRGVVDLVEDFRTGQLRPAEYPIRLLGDDTIALIPAGRPEHGYVAKLQGIDWAQLYDDGFGDYLELCRAQWTSDYDYVLLDSRTGASDIGGICTAHLPDRLVVMFTANRQSVRGAVDVARRANVARDKLPFDRPQLTVLPVLSRLDTRDEYAMSENWRKVCVEESKELYGNWLDFTVPVQLMSRHLTVPYVSYWSFGEQLAVRSEADPGADQISFALETVAAVIAHDFDRTDLLAENRDAYVAEVRTRRQDFHYDLRVSIPRSRLDFANLLVGELAQRGIRAKRSLSGDRSLLTGPPDDSRHLCLVVDGEVSRWQSAEVEQFLRRSLGQDRRVIPVLTEDTPANALSGSIRNLRYVRLAGSAGAGEIAGELANQLDGLVDPDETDLRQVLAEIADARLPPRLWPLVDETLRDVQAATNSANRRWLRELADDLTVILHRHREYQDGRVPPPPGVLKSINQVKQRSLE
jgi:MinD-like ATPase involved in chromosome partitioning or flagellar assembly